LWNLNLLLYFVFQSTFDMSNSENHLQDIKEIRQMMERSSRFFSLSGWSGISAGVFALLGVVAALILPGSAIIKSPDTFIIADALIVLGLALTSSFYFSQRKARLQGAKLWTPVSRRLVVSMAIPLLTGGIYSAVFLLQDHSQLVEGSTLIFYGLALVNAGRFVNRESVILGIAEIILGLVATIWPAYGLWLWGAGFGVFHILYGVIIHYKYDTDR
jgi:hypothetical protein